jgi:acyl carrier protein
MRDKIIQAIFGAINDINQQMPKDERLVKSPETRLYGEDGPLDSLGLVNLIVATEQHLENFCGISISLAEEHVLDEHDNRFKTVAAMADFIEFVYGESLSGQ